MAYAHTLLLRISAEMQDTLLCIADEQRRSVASVARLLIEDGLRFRSDQIVANWPINKDGTVDPQKARALVRIIKSPKPARKVRRG